MFIITNSANRITAVHELASVISLLKENEVTITDIKITNRFFLSWVGVKVSDNLHVFDNGLIAGKLHFNEEYDPHPVFHKKNVPPDLHPLLHSTLITIQNDEISIRPNEHTNIYYSKEAVSDFQLLIAKAEALKPDKLGVYLLGTTGYFPGNLTMFSEIKKIPYLETLKFPSLNTFRHATFTPSKSNDEKLIDRLKFLIPNYDKTSIALSGGLDSRFVLGLLIQKGIRPMVYSLTGNESAIVKDVCESLNLSLNIEKSNPLDEYTYTLMSDGRIYFKGGTFNQMFSVPKQDEILHSGLWADPLIENTFKTAWKRPGKIKTIYEDLISFALLPMIKDGEVKGYIGGMTKQDIFDYLKVTLSFGKTYFDFSTRKQWSSWFYHIHRGLNWINATMADASFYTYPVYLLGEKEALEIGITSSAYSNFYKERLRVLNRKLLPHVQINYSEGRPYKSLPPLIKEIHKLYYEYPKRYFVRRKVIKQASSYSNNNLFKNCNHQSSEGLEAYFECDLHDLLYNEDVQMRVKRAAVSVNNVLKFLNNQYNKQSVAHSYRGNWLLEE